eukprot:1406472-Prymnesium_polylepis.2
MSVGIDARPPKRSCTALATSRSRCVSGSHSMRAEPPGRRSSVRRRAEGVGEAKGVNVDNLR